MMFELQAAISHWQRYHSHLMQPGDRPASATTSLRTRS